MGVFSFKTHYFKNKNKEYNTARKFFKALKPKQYFCSNKLKDLILDLSTNLSYRVTEKITNKIVSVKILVYIKCLQIMIN
jgi:hypothetical protein